VGFDVHLARRAADLSARVLAITTREDSSLAAIAYKTMSRRHTNFEFRQ
jgi:DNA-binding MurR/RpiR family transcriptional regulator